MHIREIFPDVITEDLDYEYKQILNPDNPVKWAKTIYRMNNTKKNLRIWARYGIRGGRL